MSTVSTQRRFRLALFATAFLLFGSIAVNAAPYSLDAKAKNRVEFHSKATLESFSGKAKVITAEFDVDPTTIRSTTGTVTVDLRSLDTGIDLRNKHMRENHLHTDSFPSAVFELDSVAGAGTLTAAPTLITIHGTMTIHGTTKDISSPATITGLGADAVRVQAEFPLKITEYGIPRPEFLFLKLAEEVRIIVDLTLTPSVK